MSSYVQLTAQLTELLAAARRLRDEGAHLAPELEALLREVESLDTPANFPMDDFTSEFQKRLIPEGGGEPANLATREAAREVAKFLEPIGQNVLTGLVSYEGTDQDSARDIKQADQG